MNAASEATAQGRRAIVIFALLALAGLDMSFRHYIPVVGVGLSLATLGSVLWFNWGQHRVRRWRMKRPFDLYFGGDTRAEWAHEARVPPREDVLVDLRLEPRLNYKELEVLFGFEGDPNTRPLPIRVHNQFVKVGKMKFQKPGVEPGHYIDTKDAYHIQRPRDRTVGETWAIGFVVRTRAPGRYPVRFLLTSDGGEGRPRTPLTLIVEEGAHNSLHDP